MEMNIKVGNSFVKWEDFALCERGDINSLKMKLYKGLKCGLYFWFKLLLDKLV